MEENAIYSKTIFDTIHSPRRSHLPSNNTYAQGLYCAPSPRTCLQQLKYMCVLSCSCANALVILAHDIRQIIRIELSKDLVPLHQF